MDLKKLFVYVPAAAEDAFVTNVINVASEAAKYSNKIVFLEGSNRIWVKEVFYGTDLESLGKKFQSIWATIGLTAKEDGTSALSKTVGETTYTDLVAWIEALISDEATKRGNADNEIITAYQNADSAIISGYEGADSAIITAYQNADSAIISGYEGADSAIITAYQNADSAIITAYQNADTAIIAMLPGVTTDAASGITVTSYTDEAGKTTYTIHADQSIWEFMGTASATAATVATVLDAKYGEGEGQIHRAKEQGDVWAVTITDQQNNTILYAWDGTNWVQIGSAAGVSGVDTTPSHGVNLTNTASVVGVTVTPGSVAENNDSVVTGGAVFTAVQTAQANSYAKAEAEAAAAQENSYAKAEAEGTKAQDNSYAYAESLANALKTAYEQADQAIITAYEAADEAIITAYEAADEAIITAYEAADEAINAAKTKSVAANSADTAYITVDSTNDALGYAYTINFSEEAVFNYISDNIWETYSAS